MATFDFLAYWSRLVSRTSSRVALIRTVFQDTLKVQKAYTQGLCPPSSSDYHNGSQISVRQELPEKLAENVVCQAPFPELLTQQLWGRAQ